MANSSTKLTEDSFATIRNNLLKFGGGHVYLQKDGTTGIGTIYLDHSEKRNAMSGVMMVEFRDCIETLEKWKEGKAVMLCAKGKYFCSGVDLDFVKANAAVQQVGFNMTTWMQDTLNRLHRLPLISLCLIQGPTLGGGAEISLFCDFTVAADDVSYGFVHGKVGVITAWGGGTRLARKIGPSRALNLLLTSEILDANECVRVGIAETVVPTEGAFNKAMEWLNLRLKHHHSIIRAIKENVLNTSVHTYEDSLRLEKYKFVSFWGGKLNRHALNQNIHHLKKL